MKDGGTPLHHAVRLGSVELASLLLSKGADVDALSRVRDQHWATDSIIADTHSSTTSLYTWKFLTEIPMSFSGISHTLHPIVVLAFRM